MTKTPSDFSATVLPESMAAAAAHNCTIIGPCSVSLEGVASRRRPVPAAFEHHAQLPCGGDLPTKHGRRRRGTYHQETEGLNLGVLYFLPIAYVDLRKCAGNVNLHSFFRYHKCSQFTSHPPAIANSGSAPPVKNMWRRPCY